MVDVQARIVTAAAFNAAVSNAECVDGTTKAGSNQPGPNKADLLAASTLGLVKRLIDRHDDASEVVVYCDRFGGRRYYADVLQQTFADAIPAVIAESADRSAYRIAAGNRTIDVAFTVKGDRFTPVALSSMHAKYLRERMMDSFNAYFQRLHRSDVPLKPTAGYPVDADRFLNDIAPILRREKIDPDQLIRQR
jgi:hypothetical protein